MRITGAGRLGVGTASPGYAIDAAGDINCTGAFRVNGTALSNGLVGLTAGVSSAMGLTTSVADVPGTAFSLPQSGLWLFLATVHVQSGADSTLNAVAFMNIGGTQQPFNCWWGSGSSTGSEGVTTAHQITRQNSGTAVKLQAYKSGSAAATITTASCFSAIWLGP
jgi:hypothetical protein